MAYIGRQLARGENKLFDDISSSFNGSTTVFNLTVSSVATSTATPYQLFVSLGGVMQKPNTDFTTAGNQITFTTAPAAGLSCWIMMQGDTIDQAAIPDASVTPSKIAGSGDFAFPADVRLKDGDGSHYVGFEAPTTVSTNKVWTLPAADGSNGQQLTTNGSGVLSWSAAATAVNANALTGNTLASGVTASSLTSVGTLTALTVSGDVTFTGAANNIVFDKSDNALEFADNAKAIFGSSTDLSIYHDASNSYIKEAGTGQLHIQADNLILENAAGANYFVGISGGETIIYHNDSAKLTTASTGVSITGALTVSGNLTVSGTTTTVDSVTLSVKDKNIEMGVVSSPSDTTADGGGITLKGATDKTFNWVDSTDAWTSSEHIHLLDNKKLIVGTGGSDLTISHDGTNSLIDNNTGNLNIQSGGTIYLTNAAGSEVYAQFSENGAASLRYDNTTRLATTSSGINVTGAIQVNGSALSSLPTIDLVADGAIAAGKPCIVNSSGKAEAVAPAYTPQTTPSIYVGWDEFSSSGIDTCDSTFDPDLSDSLNKGIFWTIFRHEDDTNKMKLVGIDATAGNANIGVVTELNSSSNTTSGAEAIDYDTTNDKILFCYRAQGYLMVRTASATNITSGNITLHPETSLDTDNYKPDIAYGTGGKALIIHSTGGSSGTTYKARVVTIASNGSLSFGTAATFVTGSELFRLSVNYDSTNDKFLIAYAKSSDSQHGYCRVATISGTGVSFGTEVEFENGQCEGISTAWDSKNQKWVVAYNGTSNYLWVRQGTVSGTSISFGGETQISGNYAATLPELRFSEVSKTFIALYRNPGNSGRLAARNFAINGSGFTVQSGEAGGLSPDNTGSKYGVALRTTVNSSESSSFQLLGFAAIKKNNNGRGASFRFNFLNSGSNLVDNGNFIGFAPNAISDGQTGTINLPSNTVGNLSGLSAGTAYYVTSTGSLSAGWSSATVGVLALSATTGLIRT
jgi:hypothetical protein